MSFLGRKPSNAPLTTADIPDGIIVAADLAPNSVDSSELVDGSVDLSHMNSESVDEDNLHISNAGSNGEFLSKQSGNAGGMTWAAAGGGVGSHLKKTTHRETSGNYTQSGTTYYLPFDSVEHTLVATRTYVVSWDFIGYVKNTVDSIINRKMNTGFAYSIYGPDEGDATATAAGDAFNMGSVPAGGTTLSNHQLGRDLVSAGTSAAKHKFNGGRTILIPYGTVGTKYFFISVAGEGGGDSYHRVYGSPTIPFLFTIDEYEGDITNDI